MSKPLRILKASAGSGKTFSLAAHYLILLFSGPKKYREILAVTFTNKATEEMKTRILEVLEGFARGSEDVEAYRDLVLQAHPKLSKAELQVQADKIYRQILHDYSRFSVGTLDGFMQKVIRGFTFELNLTAGYNLDLNHDKVIQELAERLNLKLDEDPKLLQWIIDLAYDLIEQDKNWNYQKELLNLSKEVFKEDFEPFGQSVLEMGENADQFFETYVALCDTQKKDFEEGMLQRIQESAQQLSRSGANLDDLNGTNTRQLKNLPDIKLWDETILKNIGSLFKLIDDPERWFKKGKSNSLYDDLNPYLHRIKDFYDEHLGDYILAKAFKKKAYFLKLMAELAELLKQYRSDSESLLISDAQKLLQGIAEDAGENPSFIWEKMGSVYKHFLFDEFQDTSGSQWSSFRSLVKNAMAEYESTYPDHLIVGDTKQAIYAWRGGDYKLLHQEVLREFGEGQILQESLQDNRRSSSEIIDFNNLLYAQLPTFLQNLIQDSLSELPAVQKFWHQDSQGLNQLLPSIYANGEQRKHNKTPIGGVVRIHRVAKNGESLAAEDGDNVSENDRLLLHEMLLQVNELIQERNYKQRDLGVLVRSHADASKVVQALMAAGYDVISGEALKIANNSAVKLILQVLNYMAANTQQKPYYLANIASLYAKIQGRKMKGLDFMFIVRKPLAELEAILPLKFIQEVETWIQLPLSEILEQIIQAFIEQTQESDLFSSEENQVNRSQHIAFLLAFKDLCAKASALGEKGIVSFLQWWNQEGYNYNLPSPDTADAIQVMTIHKSKGLAFRAVLVPFCNWKITGKASVNFWVDASGTPYQALQRIPLNYGKDLASSSVAIPYLQYQIGQVLEGLNSLYVATTRAIDFLYVGFLAKGKTSGITDMGDAIWQALASEREDENILERGSFIHKDQVGQLGDALKLEQFPSSNRLLHIYELEEDKPLDYLMNLAASAKRGELLHRLMAESHRAEDIPNILQQFILEGLILEEEAQKLGEEAQKLYASSALQAYLAGPGTHWNEASIIDAQGQTRRPDKVIIHDNEVRILDYKFTLEPAPSHQEQLKNYKELLLEMGYTKVEAYLYYAHRDQLVSVLS